ncbi:class IV adenylate cyclase [Patescibacteria group bacterium AH-259-L07]|nr:class IV adenylate cyclase [Patescibacteria group bacterium AH-259-L07]
MKEIEVKFKVDNFKSVRPKLKKLGAKLDFKGREHSYFFDTTQYRLKKNKQVLRIKKQDKARLTFKDKSAHHDKKYKISDEYQVEISDIRIAKEILKRLGFVQWFEYKKYREHWKLPDAVVELDKLENNYFVEIEASKKRINELAQLLELDWNQSTTKNYLEILKEIKSVSRRRH